MDVIIPKAATKMQEKLLATHTYVEWADHGLVFANQWWPLGIFDEEIVWDGCQINSCWKMALSWYWSLIENVPIMKWHKLVWELKYSAWNIACQKKYSSWEVTEQRSCPKMNYLFNNNHLRDPLKDRVAKASCLSPTQIFMSYLASSK